MDTLHNNPPSPVDLFAEQIASLKSQADAFGAITEANAGQARDVIGLAGKLAKEIEGTRVAEKAPHLEASQRIDAAYRPLKDRAENAVDGLKRALAAYISEQKRKADEAAREAARKAADEAAKARAFADDPVIGDEAIAAAELAAQKADVAAAVVKTAGNVKGSEGFRAAGLKKVRTAKVSDPAALVAHYAPRLVAEAERLANADIRAAKGGPVSIPGIEIVETEVLA